MAWLEECNSMTTLDELEEGCILSHCSRTRLCDSCRRHVQAYIFQTNLTSLVLMMRARQHLWKRAMNPKVRRLQKAFDELCSFIEEEV